MDSHFSLRWNKYADQLRDAFGSLLGEEDLVDVTLSCEGRKIKAHKMLLSACSPYFHGVFKENPCQHPVIVFKNVMYEDLKAIVDFIYCGEVNIVQEQLESFLDTAAMLEVKGLTEKENQRGINEDESVLGTVEENMQTNLNEGHETHKTKIQDLKSTGTSGRNSPPTKKRRTSVKTPPYEICEPVEVTAVVKQEVEDGDVTAVKFEEDEVTESAEVSTPKLSNLPQESVPETLESIAESVEEQSKEDQEEEVECITVESMDEDDVQKKPAASPDTEPIEVKTAPLKRKTVPEEISSEDIVTAKSGKKTSEMHRATTPMVKPSPKTTVKGKVLIPKGLVVTPVKPTSKVEDLFDFPTAEAQVQDEGRRSEDATTPVHEEAMTYAQCDVVPTLAPEVAEEAPELQQQTEPEPEPVEEELPFDYFGCDVCKGEGKPVDLERITFSHKCPICPCCCFCTHLLKDHMRIIHGWFNVQRRFTQY